MTRLSRTQFVSSATSATSVVPFSVQVALLRQIAVSFSLFGGGCSLTYFVNTYRLEVPISIACR
jgi:hypothetical protein